MEHKENKTKQVVFLIFALFLANWLIISPIRKAVGLDFQNVLFSEKFKEYKVIEKDVRFDVPVTWWLRQLKIDNDYPYNCFVYLFAEDIQFCVVYSEKPNDEETLSDYLEAFVDDHRNYTITDNRTFVLDENKWNVIDFDYFNKNNFPGKNRYWECRTYGTLRNDGGYGFKFCMLDEISEEGWNTFDRVFQSIKFGE